MRYITIVFRFLAIIGLFGWFTLPAGCASKTAPSAFPGQKPAELKKTMTPEEEKAFIAASLSPEERKVRERAIEIRRRNEAETAKKVVKELDTPEMKEARKQIAKEAEAVIRVEKEYQKVLHGARPIGCSFEEMNINPQAVEFSLIRVMASVRITNGTGFPLSIETASRRIGVAVGNLCRNGSVTLAFSMRLMDSQYETITLVARGTDKSGRAYSQQYQIQLATYQAQYERSRSLVWDIR